MIFKLIINYINKLKIPKMKAKKQKIVLQQEYIFKPEIGKSEKKKY